MPRNAMHPESKVEFLKCAMHSSAHDLLTMAALLQFIKEMAQRFPNSVPDASIDELKSALFAMREHQFHFQNTLASLLAQTLTSQHGAAENNVMRMFLDFLQTQPLNTNDEPETAQ